ncbi:hypothetical protein HPB51_000686 [Rhipicephalus microplus]|uniref:Uncharacterized protein n=1 Tax=Rhipicephalus microplus TaxID=6941 RepID=A0A9J6EQ28_RHIMP|nr:hypothetical protein HPB51_000686 [Rhipicephalus microplus]
MRTSEATHFLERPVPGCMDRGMHGLIDNPLPFFFHSGVSTPNTGGSVLCPISEMRTPTFCSTKLHKLLSHPRFATLHQNADPAAYFSQQMKLGAPYLRGTSPVYQSQCQGPLSAPEPLTSLLEAEGRSQQGPSYKCVQLSERPSHSSFRASSFGKSLRHLTKARRPANSLSLDGGPEHPATSTLP